MTSVFAEVVVESGTKGGDTAWGTKRSAARARSSSGESTDSDRESTPDVAMEAERALLDNHWRERMQSIESVKAAWGEQIVADYRILFDDMDIDHSGTIDASELSRVFKKLDMKMSRARIHQLIESVDFSGDGEIDFEEFLALLYVAC
jgi:hypothetical protein